MALLVPLPSDVFNVFNFLLFDIVLASLVFYLTADIAGLLNSASALQRIDNRLRAYNPPLVGVGLSSTRRSAFRVLACVRAVTMLLVLATNFLIEGESVDRVTETAADVVVAGRIPPSVNYTEVMGRTLMRRGCQGRTRDSFYYGELRAGGGCELRMKYMRAPTVHFGLKYTRRVVPLRRCRRSLANRAVFQFVCENGVVACRRTKKIDNVVPESDTCRGTVLLRTASGALETHLCSGAGMDPSTRGIKSSCLLARGGIHNATTWVPFTGMRARTLRDSYDAMYGAGRRRINVLDVKEKGQHVSQVSIAWFYILGVTGLGIVVLTIADVVLRSRGFQRVANDEFGITSLLAQSAVLVEEGPDGVEVVRGGGKRGLTEVGRDLGESRRRSLVVQNLRGTLRARAVL